MTDSATPVEKFPRDVKIVRIDFQLSGKARKLELFTQIPQEIEITIALKTCRARYRDPRCESAARKANSTASVCRIAGWQDRQCARATRELRGKGHAHRRSGRRNFEGDRSTRRIGADRDPFHFRSRRNERRLRFNSQIQLPQSSGAHPVYREYAGNTKFLARRQS